MVGDLPSRRRRNQQPPLRSTWNRHHPDLSCPGHGLAHAHSPPPCDWEAPGLTSVRSAAGELRLARAVLDERLHADGPVLGGEQRGELLRLDGETGVEVDGQALVDRLLRGAQRIRRSVGELLRPASGDVVDLLGRNDLVDEAYPQRLLSADEPSGEAEVL